MMNLTNLPIEKSIEACEALMLNEDQVDCPVYHHFGPGIYMREVFIPAGSIALGHEHRFEHMNILLKGRISLIQPNGSLVEYQAPMMLTTPPGRKLAYTHEDVVWVNVYSETEQDVEKLEEKLLIKSDVWKDYASQIKLLRSTVDNDDYELFLREQGLTEDEVQAIVQNEDDQIDFPYGSFPVVVAASGVHGKGIFATAPFEAGALIGPGRLAGKRTPIGRFTNHSKDPNARFIKVSGDILLVAVKNIAGSKGSRNGDEITVDYRDAYRLAKELT